MLPEYDDLDATALADLVHRGEVHPRDLVDAAIERAEARNPSLNAIIHRQFERARADAERVETEAPFAGVPFVFKDYKGREAGEPYHAGNRTLRDLDYRPRSAFWFEGNRRGALEEILRLDAQQPAPAIYVNTDRIAYIESYWRFYQLKHRRPDLQARTVYFDFEHFDARSMPAGSLMLARADDTRAAAAVTACVLRQLETIPELADAPNFAIYQR